MRRASVLLQLTIIVFAISLQAADPIFDAEPTRTCFVDLLQKAAWGLSGPFERAAFVVEPADGALQCVPWPPRHFYLAERFRGPIPAGTVAIVHTHPVDLWMPSRHDIDEAARLGLPIYVLSIRGVYKVDPRSHSTITIAVGGSWIRQISKAAIATPSVTMSAPAAMSP